MKMQIYKVKWTKLIHQIIKTVLFNDKQKKDYLNIYMILL